MSDFNEVLLQPLDYVLQNARYARRHPAFIVGQQQVTWAEFERRTARLAAKFADVGLRSGDFATLLLGSGLNFLESLVAVWRVGAVPVPIATSLPGTAAAGVAQDAMARVLIAEQATLSVAQATAPHCSLRVLLDGAAEGWIDARLLDANPDALSASGRQSADALCSVMYSSGTTGQPKGIVHTQLARAQMIDMFVAHMKLDAETVAIISTPLSANGSWCILLPTMGVGGTTIIVPKFDAAGFQHACLRYRPTYALLVPTQVQMLFDHPDFDPRSLASFKSLMVSGSPLSSVLRERLRAAMPGSLVEVYGTSEGVAVATAPKVAAGKERSVGKPMRGYDVRIIDEAGFEVEAGVIGEIVGRGPSMMARYNHQPQLTEQVTWTSSLGFRFLRTGDLGYMDEDAYVYVTGRKKDMIISGGQNIYPIDIEEILLTHEDVAEAAVIGVEHAKWGESPAAAVVAKPGRSLDAVALRDWINARVAKHQRLIALEVVAALPRNAMGKVLKREIRLAEMAT